MHFTNEYINGTILVDLRINVFYNDDDKENENNYTDYKLIDIDERKNSNKNLILYSLSYSGSSSDKYDEIFKISEYFLTYIIIFIICYLLIVFFTILICFHKCGCLDISGNYCTYFSLLIIILSIIILIIHSIFTAKNNRINKYYKDGKYKNDTLIIIIFIIDPLFMIVFICCFACCHEGNSYDCYSIDIEQFCKAFVFIPFIIFPILILFNELYNEGYVDTIIDNWKKNPIMDIQINNLNNEDSIGFFKNF